MVYESDFYTRRPYRAAPSLSTYTVTTEPSRQIRILPGLGKVHVVHSYDRIVPYVGHKRLTVVTSQPKVIHVRPSVLYREFDRIEHKYRPFSYGSATSDYLNSNSSVRIVYVNNGRNYYSDYQPKYYYDSYYRYPLSSTSTYTTYPRFNSYYYNYYPLSLPSTSRLYTYFGGYRPYYNYLNDSYLYPSKNYTFSRMFEDETRLLRAESAALLSRINTPISRSYRAMPLPYISSRYEYPTRWSNDDYINKMIVSSPQSTYKSNYVTYSTEPVRRYFGQGHLSCINLLGDKSHPKRKSAYVYVDLENRRHPVMKDIELMSYYINRMRTERAQKQAIIPSIADEKVGDPKITEITE